MEQHQIDRAELRELYRISIEEYRFQTKLNWDRMQYYLVLNLGVISVATGLLKMEASRAVLVLVALIFAIGCLTSIIGVLSVRRERSYYLATVYKKTLIEDQLGFGVPLVGYNSEYATLALATTRGMRRTDEILKDTEEWMQRALIPRGSSTFYTLLLLGLLTIIDACAVAFIIRLIIVRS